MTSIRCLLLAIALAPAVAAQHNVLLIIADDLGVDYVNVYGEGPAPGPTPNIDALASQGVLFRNAWANPTCSPTRACFHTGRHGYRTGVGDANDVLDPQERTLPELLDERGTGYAHALIGKWHLGTGLGQTAPNQQGWSHFAGMLGGGVTDYYWWPRTVNGSMNTSTTYATTQITDDAIAWIQAQSGPWLCTVAYNAPHSPYHTPPATLHTQSLAGVPPFDSVPFFRAAVEAMDTEIGRLLASLGSDPAQTNIIFLGDNGTPARVSETPFERDHAKGSPYEGGVNVPLIVAGPAVQSPNRESQQLVHANDLYATVAELAGADPEASFRAVDAISFVPYLANPSQLALREIVYTERFMGPADTSGFATTRDARYKAIRNFGPTGSADELYDLLTDPFELNNLLLGPLSTAEQQAYDALTAEIGRVRNTTGSFTTFGSTACAGSNGNPAIAGTTPRIAQSYTISLSSALASTPVALNIGTSIDAWASAPLPFALQSIGGGPGCSIYASGDIQASTMTDGTGNASLAIALPSSTLFLNAPIHHQWLVIDLGAPSNALGVVTTAGATALPGL